MIALALAGVGVATARALAPRVHARLLARCERMFEQLPEEFPPKRMLRGVEEIRANSLRALALLEASEQARAVQSVRAATLLREAAPLRRSEHEELVAAGAGLPGSDPKGDGETDERRSDRSAG